MPMAQQQSLFLSSAQLWLAATCHRCAVRRFVLVAQKACCDAYQILISVLTSDEQHW